QPFNPGPDICDLRPYRCEIARHLRRGPALRGEGAFALALPLRWLVRHRIGSTEDPRWIFMQLVSVRLSLALTTTQLFLSRLGAGLRALREELFAAGAVSQLVERGEDALLAPSVLLCGEEFVEPRPCVTSVDAGYARSAHPCGEFGIGQHRLVSNGNAP